VFAARIQAYIRTNAARGRDTERVGPFLATFARTTTNPFLNYAIPEAGAVPSPADASALIRAYRSRDRLPRLEYLPGLAPAVEPALLAAGFTVEQRVPLMHCPPGAVIEQPAPDGIELLAPETDAEIMAMIVAQHEAYDEVAPPTEDDVAARHKHLAAGGLAVLARDTITGEPAGGGICDVVLDGIGELAGFGVRKKYRGRGIAAAITANLTRRAHEAGAVTAFLTPGGEPAERIYARAGYRRVDEVLFLRADK
jgi:GNAT superfamily N-acetyltransferase